YDLRRPAESLPEAVLPVGDIDLARIVVSDKRLRNTQLPEPLAALLPRKGLVLADVGQRSERRRPRRGCGDDDNWDTLLDGGGDRTVHGVRVPGTGDDAIRLARERCLHHPPLCDRVEGRRGRDVDLHAQVLGRLLGAVEDRRKELDARTARLRVREGEVP